jgi:hypothetical protein
LYLSWIRDHKPDALPELVSNEVDISIVQEEALHTTTSWDFHHQYQCKERKAHSVKYKFELRTQKEEMAYPEHRHRDLLEDRSQEDEAEEDEQMDHEG